jgi:non-ribosomal peptide synthetase component F
MPIVRCDPHAAAAGNATLYDGLAAQPPERIALVDASGSLTFSQLLDQASQLATHLNENGVGPSDHVLVRGDRSIASVVAIHAVLMAGAGFVAVPAAQPAAAVHALNRQAAITTVLGETDADMDAIRSSPVMWQLNYREFLRALPPSCPYIEPAYPVLASQPATVVFPTGGSRGIVFSHAALLATLRDVARRFGIGPADRVLGTAPMGAAQALADLFLPALTGCTAILDGHDGSGATIWHGDVAHLVGTAPVPWPGTLRLCLFNAPGLAPTLPASALQALPPVPFAVLGTIPEIAIWTTCRAADDTNATLLAGARAFAAEAPGGDTICLGSPALAQEYINDASVSAAAFAQQPDGERALRCATRARLRPDGALELPAPRTEAIPDTRQLEPI